MRDNWKREARIELASLGEDDGYGPDSDEQSPWEVSDARADYLDTIGVRKGFRDGAWGYPVWVDALDVIFTESDSAFFRRMASVLASDQELVKSFLVVHTLGGHDAVVSWLAEFLNAGR